MKAEFSVKGLTAWYVKEKPVLQNLTFQLQKHEAVGIIGLNGAGKTTLLNCLCGLHDRFQAEHIQWEGEDISLRNPAFMLRRYAVFDGEAPFGYFTFREYLAYVFGTYKRQVPDIETLVQGFSFEKYEDVLIKELSTGNKKKVYLITAFALRPELLFLDEPVNGLDFQSTEFLYTQIKEYKEYGTVFFSSHVLESVSLTADRILLLKNGSMEELKDREWKENGDIREVLRHV